MEGDLSIATMQDNCYLIDYSGKFRSRRTINLHGVLIFNPGGKYALGANALHDSRG